MRALRVLLTLLLLAVAALATTGVASAAPAKYVALGDSYAVGVGTYTYDTPATDCRRGPLAYSRLWAAAHPSTTYVEASCSGATTADVINTQMASVTPDTTLVTVQVGGNDVGFVSVLENCILTLSDQDCVNGVNAAEAAAQNVLPGELAATYAAIRAHAPSAKVVVVGYPRFYKIGGNCGIFGLSDTERSALNAGSDVIAGVLAAQAASAGFTFLDGRTAFAGHEICSGSEWLTSLQWDKIDESYHPNALGHKNGYLPALTALVG
jgi:lysophospholipase L1-like esterase